MSRRRQSTSFSISDQTFAQNPRSPLPPSLSYTGGHHCRSAPPRIIAVSGLTAFTVGRLHARLETLPPAWGIAVAGPTVSTVGWLRGHLHFFSRALCGSTNLRRGVERPLPGSCFPILPAAATMLRVLRSTRSGRVFNPTALRCDAPTIADLLANPLHVDIDTSDLLQHASIYFQTSLEKMYLHDPRHGVKNTKPKASPRLQGHAYLSPCPLNLAQRPKPGRSQRQLHSMAPVSAAAPQPVVENINFSSSGGDNIHNANTATCTNTTALTAAPPAPIRIRGAVFKLVVLNGSPPSAHNWPI
ncbi:hypothetical protein ARMSODRAFT_982995 [Armillaria solidipes]|uniref:Uncharacterized protein n=1 Tax=Armillaria solidipes TaxID=1076256 RepID=A0A2H3AKT7_9AGAR|nr:hypothetical protein ARMSODRAFT_982995 [Armillaria solidipes]